MTFGINSKVLNMLIYADETKLYNMAADKDWKTYFSCKEIRRKINGENIYFHLGFHKAANYILNKIDNFLKRDYKAIYFIGHSYAAVSSVLTMLIKSDEKLKNKEIYGIAFATPPAMSYVPL